jgi:hypothetical protein
MPNYKNGKVYKIVDVNEEMVYIGSTTRQLGHRMAGHRSDFKRNQYCSSSILFNKYGVENCKILLLENYPCNNKEELNSKEGEYIKTLNCINKQISGQTKKEYYEKNKEKILNNFKEYREINKERIKEHKHLKYLEKKELKINV